MTMLWALQQALYERWTGDDELSALVGDRVYDGIAPAGTEFPYIRTASPTEVPGYQTFGRQGWNDTITVDVFSRYEGSKEALGSIVPAMHAALAEPLVMEGFGIARLKPEFTTLLTEEGGIRHATVRYRIISMQAVEDGGNGNEGGDWDASATRGLSLLLDVAQINLPDGTLVTGFTDWGPNSFIFTSSDGHQYTYRTDQLNGGPILQGDGSAVFTATNVDLRELGSANEFSAYFLVDADWENDTSYGMRIHSGEGAITLLLTGAQLGFKCGLTYQVDMSDGLIDFGVWPIVEVHKSGANAEILVNGVTVMQSSIFEALPSGAGMLGLLGSFDGANYGWRRARFAMTATVNHTEDERNTIRNGLYAIRGITF